MIHNDPQLGELHWSRLNPTWIELDGLSKGAPLAPLSSITFLEVQPSMTSFTLKLPVMQQSLGCLAVGCCVLFFSQYGFWSWYQNHLDAKKRETSTRTRSIADPLKSQRSWFWRNRFGGTKSWRPTEEHSFFQSKYTQGCQMLHYFDGSLKAVGTSTHHPTATTREIRYRMKSSW